MPRDDSDMPDQKIGTTEPSAGRTKVDSTVGTAGLSGTSGTPNSGWKRAKNTIVLDHAVRSMKSYTVSRTELWALASSGFIGSTAIAFAVYFYKLWANLPPGTDAAIMGALYGVMIALGVVAVLGYGLFLVLVFRIKREHGDSVKQSLLP